MEYWSGLLVATDTFLTPLTSSSYDKVRLAKHLSCRVQFEIVFESAAGEQRLCLIDGEGGILRCHFHKSRICNALDHKVFSLKNLDFHSSSLYITQVHSMSSRFRPEFSQFFHNLQMSSALTKRSADRYWNKR